MAYKLSLKAQSCVMAYKLSLKAQFEIKDVKRDPYDIHTWFKNIYKSLLKVSPLIWA